MEHLLNCRFDRDSKNISFAVYQDNELVAIAPLILQAIYGETGSLEFAMGGTNNPFPAVKNDLGHDNTKKILNIIFKNIDPFTYAIAPS